MPLTLGVNRLIDRDVCTCLGNLENYSFCSADVNYHRNYTVMYKSCCEIVHLDHMTCCNCSIHSIAYKEQSCYQTPLLQNGVLIHQHNGDKAKIPLRISRTCPQKLKMTCLRSKMYQGPLALSIFISVKGFERRKKE